MTPTRYRIAASDPNADLSDVRCSVADPDPAGQAFRLPAWSPDSYLIREFAKHFVAVRAECDGSPKAKRRRIELRRLDQILSAGRERAECDRQLLRQRHADCACPRVVKGTLIALALELKLRLHSAMSLDDVMRALWRRYGQTGIGVPEDGVQTLAAELSGLDLDTFFRDYVHGTVELPLPSLLREFGVVWNLRPAANAKDRGGAPDKDPAPRVWLGATMAAGADLRLKHLAPDGPAALAGLASGDAIVAVDGLQASHDGLDRLVRTRNTGDVVEIHAFRRDELMRFAVELAPARIDTCWLTLAEPAAPEVAARRQAWLGAQVALG